MAKVAIGLGFLVIIVVSGVAGAGVYGWLDNETEASGRQKQGPILTDEEVVDLVTTKMLLESYFCLHLTSIAGLTASRDSDATQILLGQTEAVYKHGIWVASNNVCTFVVGDRTGKVTGP